MAMSEIGRRAGDHGMAEVEQLLTVSRRPVIAHRLSVFLAELQQVGSAVPAATALCKCHSKLCLPDAAYTCGFTLLRVPSHGSQMEISRSMHRNVVAR